MAIRDALYPGVSDAVDEPRPSIMPVRNREERVRYTVESSSTVPEILKYEEEKDKDPRNKNLVV